MDESSRYRHIRRSKKPKLRRFYDFRNQWSRSGRVTTYEMWVPRLRKIPFIPLEKGIDVVTGLRKNKI